MENAQSSEEDFVIETDDLNEFLKDERKLFRLFAERLLDVIWVIGPDLRTLYVSPSIRRMRGFTPEERMAQSIEETMTEESARWVKEEMKKVLVKGREGLARPSRRVVELELLRKDGSTMRAEVRVSALRNSKGELIGLVGITRDITEQKKMEDRLRESEERLRNILEASPDAIVMTELDGTVVECNSATLSLLELSSKEEIVGKKSIDLISPKELSKARKNLRRLLETGVAQGMEYTVRRDDGKELVIETSARLVRDSSGNPTFIIATARDITERKRMEEELKKHREHLEELVKERTSELFESNQLLRREIEKRLWVEEALRRSEQEKSAILDGMSGVIVYLDTEMRVIWANRTACEAVRLQPHQLLGRFCYEVWHRRSEPCPNCPVPRTLQSGIPTESEVTSPGNGVWLVRSSLVYEKDEKVVGVVIAGLDITEKKRADEAVRSYQQQLRSLALELTLAEERERRRIAAGIHDLIGQTLAACKIKLDSLLRSEQAEGILDSLKEIRVLIEQTLTSARSLTFELSPPVLYELGFDAAIEWLVEQHRKKYDLNISFHTDQSHKPLSENISITLFRAVQELLLNIVKHAKASSVEVSVRKEKESIVVTVEDDGAGFDTERLQRDAVKTGYGLFSIRERLNHIGGSLEIESEPDKGTTVVLTAPLEAEENLLEGRAV